MKVTLLRDSIIGRQKRPGILNCAKAGETVDLDEQAARELIFFKAAKLADDEKPQKAKQ